MNQYVPFVSTPTLPSSWDTFRWATVTDDDPLAIRLDGDLDALPLVPDSLVTGLVIGQRVWVQLFAKRIIVLGAATAVTGGDTGWVDISTYGSGYFTEWSAGVYPQVRKIGGQVYLRGEMKNTSATDYLTTSSLTANNLLFTLDAQFRGTSGRDTVVMTSGSGAERWTLRVVHADGKCHAHRHTGTISSGTWLPFNANWRTD